MASRTAKKPDASMGEKPIVSPWIHFAAGGFGGILGAIVTCPLEVVKTRLQSSKFTATAMAVPLGPPGSILSLPAPALASRSVYTRWLVYPAAVPKYLGHHIGATLSLMRDVKRTEGAGALWKGLGPNLVGVVPSRAIYFATYSKSKDICVDMNHGRENSLVHLLSAVSAGLVTATTTNPVWMIKTRVQLAMDSPGARPRYTGSVDCLRTVVREEGVAALYKGLTASYLGIAESAMQFVVYEKLKAMKRDGQTRREPGPGHSSLSNKTWRDWLDCLAIASTAKLIAAVTTYPHEVLRTRLRQPANEHGKHPYATLRQTVATVLRDEGVGALYNGLTAHLMRVIPNAAIMFLSYELIVHFYAQKKDRGST